ncbi:unnamed protein product [Rotaria sp. Silwood1]|nr:unnamed protein product [Rotaria sp. Silwood1]CAF4737892.1 unnamed protein product [Rotaria sp. Silwood1]
MMDFQQNAEADEKSPDRIDAVIVGAGFAGLYMLHRLREQHISVRVIEAGSGIGGTWFWNRYPGARCDIESMEYSYSFSDELRQEWHWTDLYASQPEILRYLNYVADKFNLRRDIQLETRVIAATFDDDLERWKIQTDRGDRLSAKFCIMATGCLSVPKFPNIKGLDSFKGNLYHTGRWPHEDVRFTGCRVAIIGTGSSGIQSIPVIAEQATHVFVFQQTPNFSIPSRNMPLKQEYERWWKSNYVEHRRRMRESPIGMLIPGKRNWSAFSVTPEERQKEYEVQWQIGGYKFICSFNDIMINKESNDTAADFVRAKIRTVIKDPAVVEALLPYHYPFGAKRLCVDTHYFETFNRDNVTLVDLRNGNQSVLSDQSEYLNEIYQSKDLHKLLTFQSSKIYPKKTKFTIEQQIDAFNTLYDPSLLEEICHNLPKSHDIRNVFKNEKLIEFIRWTVNHLNSFENQTIQNTLGIVENILQKMTNNDLQFLRIVFQYKEDKLQIEKQEQEIELIKNKKENSLQ